MKMMTMLAAGAAAILTSTPASAAEIVYTFTGDFVGTLDGVAFDTPAVITAIGDTDTFSMPAVTKFVNLSSVSALAGGVTYNVTSTTQFYLTGSNFAGLFFGSAGDGGGGFAGRGPGLAGYDGVSNLATTPFADYFTGPVFVRTDRGDVRLTSFDNGTFSAQLTAAVPEPATWALMLLGFGAVGGAMRAKRKKANVTVSYA